MSVTYPADQLLVNARQNKHAIHKTTVRLIVFAECIYPGIDIKLGACKLHPVYKDQGELISVFLET